MTSYHFPLRDILSKTEVADVFPLETSHNIAIVLRSYESSMIFLTNQQVSDA